jgi:hypothetical protein
VNDTELLATYGACWWCGGPREAGIYVNDDLTDVRGLLVCKRDASHGRSSETPTDDMHRATADDLARLRERMPA